MDHALEIYRKKELIFFSDNKWLHPLFELEIFLYKSSEQIGNLIAKDKIIGKAAAMILLHFGFTKIFAETMSEPARDYLTEKGVEFNYKQLIHRVACRTENLLLEENDPAQGYQLVKRLREKALLKNSD